MKNPTKIELEHEVEIARETNRDLEAILMQAEARLKDALATSERHRDASFHWLAEYNAKNHELALMRLDLDHAHDRIRALDNERRSSPGSGVRQAVQGSCGQRSYRSWLRLFSAR